MATWKQFAAAHPDEAAAVMKQARLRVAAGELDQARAKIATQTQNARAADELEKKARGLYEQRLPILPEVKDGKAVSKPTLSEARIETYVQNAPDYAAQVAAGQRSPKNYIKRALDYEAIDTGGGNGKVTDADYADAMTPAQLRTYDYLLSKYGEKRAKSYFKAVAGENREKVAAAEDEKIRQQSRNAQAKGGGAAALDTARTVLTDAATMLTAPIAYTEAVGRAALGKPIDPTTQAQRGIRNAEAQHEAWREGKSGLASSAMDLGASMAKSGLGMLISAATGSDWAGSVLMGIDAAAQSAYDFNAAGATPRRAAAAATARGAAEMIFEKLSIGNLLKSTGAGAVALKDILLMMGNQAGVEASEELFTEWANTVSDLAILGDKSDVSRFYKAQVKDGASPADAVLRTVQQFGVINPAKAGLMGAASGFLFGAGGAVVGTFEAAQRGAQLRESGAAGAVVEAARSGEYGERAKRAAADYARGEHGRLTDKQIGSLDMMMQEAVMQQQKQQQKQERKEAREARAALADDRIRARFAPRTDSAQFPVRIEAQQTPATNTATAAQMGAQQTQTAADIKSMPRYDSTLTERQSAVIDEANRQLGEGAVYNASKTAQGAEQRAVAELAARFGLDAVFFDSNAARGFNSEGTIYINRAEVGAALRQIADHEIYHGFTAEDKAAIDKLLKQSRPLGDEGAQYQSLYDALKARYDARTGREHTPEEVREEFAARVYSELMNNEAFRERMTQDSPTLMSKIVNAIKNFIWSVKNYLTTGSRYGKLEGRYLESLRDMEQFAADVERVLKKAQSRTQTNTQEQSVESNLQNAQNIKYQLDERDRAYMNAVNSGDMETAQKMVRDRAAERGYFAESDYQGTSAFNGEAPSDMGYYDSQEERIEAFANGEGEGDMALGDYMKNKDADIGGLELNMTHPNFYRAATSARKEAIRNLRSVINSNKQTIRMYRSVPTDIVEKSFRNGDWITPSREYAVENAQIHGWGDNYNIIEQDVPVDAVWWDGNDIAEWGYDDGNSSKVYKNTENNVKLDEVTYDDKGNIIPLSKRFDPNNPDIRFALPEGEQTRTDNFKRWFGDWENDPANASKVVNADGTPKVMYHGTPYGGFTEFKNWQYFTDDKKYADVYHEPSASSIRGRYADATNPTTYEVYLNVRNPFDTRIPEIRKLWEDEFYGKYGNRTPLSDKGLPDWTEGIDIIDFIEDNDYDFDAIILDEGAVGGYGEDVNSRGISYVVRNSNQIKSATDNIGTFDPSNPDIRFALPEGEQSDVLADKVIELTEMSRDADYTRNDIKADIQSVLDGLKEGGYSDDAYAAAWDKLGEIASKAARYTTAENSIADDAPTMYDSYDYVRAYLRNTPIKVDVRGEFGGKKDAETLRRRNLSRVRISKSGTPIDTVYQELAEMAPDLFDANSQVSEGDQIRRIYEVADMLYDRGKKSQPLDDRQKRQMADWAQGELFGALLEAVEGGSDAEAAQSARKQKVSQHYTNTLKRSTVLNEETNTFAQLPEEDFYYTPTTNEEQRAEAARRLDEYGMDAEMKRLSGKETFSDGGVDIYEASLITQKLARDGDVKGLRDWAALTAAKVREAARTLQATDAAWEKSPTAGVQKEAQIVDKQREDADKAQPKKAKERKRKERLSSEVQKQTEEEAFDQIGKEVEEIAKGMTLDAEIEDAVNATQGGWKALITDYYTKGDAAGRSVEQYIIDKTGLHGKEAADLAAHIEQRYFELVEKKAHMYFEQVAIKEPKFEAGKAEANERAKLVEDRISRLFNSDLKREYTERVIRTLESVYPADDENGRRRIGLIEQLIKANGIDITEIAKLGVTATDEAIDAHLREILKPLEGRITVKDRRVLRDTAYNVFAYMADVRRDQLLNKYFHIDKSTGTTEIKSVRKATKFDKITDIIRANGERRAALLEDLFREADGQPSLTQNDIAYILNVMNRAQEIEDKESYEYRRLMGLAKKAIENKQSPTRGAKAVAFRRINMLLNPRTVETRNAGSNLAMLPLNVARDYVGAGIDAAVSKMLGTDRTMARRTAEDYKRFAAGFKKGAREAVADYRNGVNTRNYTGSWDIEGREAFAPGDTVFGSQRLNDLLRKADRLTGAALDLGDRPFYEAYYADAMSQLERIYGKEEANTDEVRAMANEIALDRTWQNDTFLAEKAKEVRRAFNGYSDKFYDGLSRIAGREIYGAGLGDILIPFTKTPANLTRAALQYNPAGFAVAGAHFIELTKAAKAGRPTRALQRKFVEEMTKAMTGTLLWLVGAYLAKKKVFNDDYSAEGDTYDLQKFKKEVEGIQPNSFTIGGVNFSTDWMQPIAEALTGGASYETARASGENAASALLHSAGVQATTIMNASYVKTIADFFKTLGDQQNGSKADRWKTAVLGFAKNSASQLVPLSSLARQTGYLFDDSKRSTADVDDVRTAARSFLSGIPWAMNKLEPNLNAFGENVKRSAFSGSVGGRLFDAYLNPSSTSRVQSDSVTRELDRVYSQTGASGVIPKEVEKSVTYDGNKYKLTPKQITAYQRMVGRDIYMSLDTVMSGGTVGDVINAKSGKLKPLLDKRYDELTDEEKAEVIAKIQSDARARAKAQMKDDIEANGVPAFVPKKS